MLFWFRKSKDRHVQHNDKRKTDKGENNDLQNSV
jgi:hypothetical protein